MNKSNRLTDWIFSIVGTVIIVTAMALGIEFGVREIIGTIVVFSLIYCGLIAAGVVKLDKL